MANFSYLLENIDTTKGNLSFLLSKLSEEGYIEIKKTTKGNYPLTTCSLTDTGVAAFEKYVRVLGK